MEDFVEEITDKIKTSFTVSSIPIGVLKEFKKFCREECGDVYWVGIFQLMKTKKHYEELLSNYTPKTRKEVKTFE